MTEQFEQKPNFHPELDGKLNDGPFSKLLVLTLALVSKGKARADLRLIQRELLRRGWHP